MTIFGLNQDQFYSLARQVLLVIGTLATTLGWATPDKVAGWTATVLSMVGPIFILISSIWSLMRHTQANIVTAAATLKDAEGTLMVKKVDLNPLAQGVTDLNRATPTNVSIPPATATAPTGGGSL